MLLHQSSVPLSPLLDFSKKSKKKPNVLLTYTGKQVMNDFTIKNRGKIGSLILDCGAFTLNNNGNKKKGQEEEELFERYRIFLRHANKPFDFVFSFDPDFSMNGFNYNLEYLLELKQEKLHTIMVPVVHNIYDKNEIKYFIQNGYQIIAIGQCKGRDNLPNLASAVYQIYNAGIKVHLFGMSIFHHLAHVPAYSSDSSSWVQNQIRGQILYWNSNRDGEDKTDRIYFPKHQGSKIPSGSYYYAAYDFRNQFEAHIYQTIGITINDLIGAQSEHYQQLVNILYYTELEQAITEAHSRQGFIF